MHNFSAIRSAVLEKMTFEVATSGNFPDIPELKLPLPFWVMEGGCDVVRLYVLQSYRPCTFCKCKTRGETQCLIKLAAPCTLTNHNEMNSDDTLPFIISSLAMARIASGVNACWSIWRHKQTLIGVIRPLAGGKCRILFSSISLLSLRIFPFGIFVYCFVRAGWSYRTKTVFIQIAL